jgi:hypothetical protein
MTQLTHAQLWAISLGNGIAVMNDTYTDRLEIEDFNNKQAQLSWLQAFDRDWGITDKASLDETCHDMIEGGHSATYDRYVQDFCSFSESQFAYALNLMSDEKQKTRARLVYAHRFSLGRGGIKAWDIGRIAFVLRQAYFLEMISKEECWQRLFGLAESAQKAYSDWHNYGFAYYVGRFFWRSDSINETACAQAFTDYNKILGNPDSTWNWLNWNTKLIN